MCRSTADSLNIHVVNIFMTLNKDQQLCRYLKSISSVNIRSLSSKLLRLDIASFYNDIGLEPYVPELASNCGVTKKHIIANAIKGYSNKHAEGPTSVILKTWISSVCHDFVNYAVKPRTYPLLRLVELDHMWYVFSWNWAVCSVAAILQPEVTLRSFVGGW